MGKERQRKRGIEKPIGTEMMMEGRKNRIKINKYKRELGLKFCDGSQFPEIFLVCEENVILKKKIIPNIVE